MNVQGKRGWGRRLQAASWRVGRKMSFKRGYWLGLVVFFTFLLGLRAGDWQAGKSSELDIGLFFAWLALLALPLVQEFSFSGFTLKKEIENAKDQIVNRVVASIAQTQSNTFNLWQHLPSDAEAQRLQREAQRQANQPHPDDVQASDPEDESRTRGETTEAAPSEVPDIAELRPADPRSNISEILPLSMVADRSTTSSPHYDDPESELAGKFGVIRVKLEKEVRRIARDHGIRTGPGASTMVLAERLHGDGVIPRRLLDLTLALYSACSAALHGEELTPSQIDFVINSQRQVIRTLRRY